MKTKTKTYLLLAAVLGIWGTVGYKILSTTHHDTPNLDLANGDVSFNPQAIVKKDTFSIQMTDRDPFLGTLSSERKTTSKKRVVIPEKGDTSTQPIITYQGLVKKQKSLDQIFTLSINNQQYLLKKGQTVQEVTLVRGYTKEVVVRYLGELMTIAKQ